MSSHTETDYEKQFKEDLERATALSLETLALEEFRRSKLQYSHSDAVVCSNKYAQNQSRLRPGSFNADVSDSKSSISTPPVVPPRRHSEVRLHSEKNEDNDLISFASPTATKKEENVNFEKLIGDIHRLNNQVEQPTSQRDFGSSSVLLTNPLQDMQLVPYNPSETQKAPITNEQLNRLYNMQPQMSFRGQYQPHIPHFIPPQSNVVPVAPYNYPPPPTYGFQMHLFPSHNTTQQQHPIFPQLELPNQLHQNFTKNSLKHAAVQVPQQANQYQSSVHQIPQIPKSASVSSISGLSPVDKCTSEAKTSIAKSSITEVVRRPKKSVGCDDLIDLGHEDNSRVSVLEAFDPLLSKDWDDTGKRKALVFKAYSANII